LNLEKYTFGYIKRRIEDAGETEIALRVTGCYPAKYKAAWPDYPQEPSESYGYNETTMKPPQPTASDITDWEEVMEWRFRLSKHCRRKKCLHFARMVVLGSLGDPITGKRLYSWRKIGKMIKRDHKTAKSWYDSGIQMLTDLLNREIETKKEFADMAKRFT